jgi:hypothetical protein
MVDHAVQGKRASAVVRYHPKVCGTRLRHSMSGHAIHPWQKIRTEGVRKTTFLNLNVTLFTYELRFLLVAWGGLCLVVCRWVAVNECVGPRPKTVTEPSADRVNKKGIGVIYEQFLKAVDVNRGDDFKKGGVLKDSAARDRVINFRGRWRREGGGSFRPLSNGRGERRLRVPKVVPQVPWSSPQDLLI